MSKFTWSGWYHALLAYMQKAGFDIEQLNHQAGIQCLAPEPRQITQDDMTRLWSVALEASDDPLLGLKVGQSVKPGAIGVISWAMMSSQTVGEGIKVLINHQHLLADALDFSVIDHEQYIEVVLNNIGDELPASPLSIDASIMTFVSFFRWLTRDSAMFHAVYLNRVELAEHKIYEQCLNCRVRYKQSQNSVWIKRAELAQPLMTADVRMSALHLQDLDRLAKQKLQGDCHKVVTKLIRQYLGQAQFSSDFIARRMHMSKSTLQRNLAFEQTSFQALLDEARINLGLSLIRHSNMPLVRIAERLGYASSNSFCRGFKRMTGRSPGDYRKM